MSDKVFHDADKGDIRRFQTQKDQIIKSATLPPALPPSRKTTKSTPPQKAPQIPKKPPGPPYGNMSCPKCGDTKGECIHQYEEVGTFGQLPGQETNKYEPLVTVPEMSGSDINSRLRKIEDNQMRLRSEFNDFRTAISNEIKSIDSSINYLKEMSDSLDESMRDSFAYVHNTMDKMHKQLLENNDHLGKQMLDVRRDILEFSKQVPKCRSQDPALDRKKQMHSFEWEVGNLDSLVKHQQIASSQSYLVGQIDFKLVGGAVCTRDGRLCVKISGDFAHMPMNSWERKNGDFECAAYLVDKTGKQSDFMMGRIIGDFNKGKEWAVGDVPACDVKLKGYANNGGIITLKIVIDVLG